MILLKGGFAVILTSTNGEGTRLQLADLQELSRELDALLVQRCIGRFSPEHNGKTGGMILNRLWKSRVCFTDLHHGGCHDSHYCAR